MQQSEDTKRVLLEDIGYKTASAGHYKVSAGKGIKPSRLITGGRRRQIYLLLSSSPQRARNTRFNRLFYP